MNIFALQKNVVIKLKFHYLVDNLLHSLKNIKPTTRIGSGYIEGLQRYFPEVI